MADCTLCAVSLSGFVGGRGAAQSEPYSQVLRRAHENGQGDMVRLEDVYKAEERGRHLRRRVHNAVQKLLLYDREPLAEQREIERNEHHQLDYERAEGGEGVYLVLLEERHALAGQRLLVALMLLLCGVQLGLHGLHAHLRAYGRGKDGVEDRAHDEGHNDNGQDRVALRHEPQQEHEQVVNRLY